jgi:DNA-binding response OmpR family regulator
VTALTHATMTGMARVLLVEDDEGIRTSLRLALEQEQHTVMEAGSTEEGLELFTAHGADVVLVDLMLPGRDGFECARQLRQRSDVPVIMVTARSDTHDVVAALEAGADDYVTKPFATKELTARIRAVLRRARSAPPAHPVITVGELEIRPDEGVVKLRGDEVALTKTEFRLLCEMAAAPGRVFSRELLLENVWGYDYFGDGRLVDVHIRRLRSKVEPDPQQPRHVVTVRGLGYKIAP